MTGKWKYKEGNPEYERYIHSGAWREKANARLGMDGYVCRVCGGRATDVHHLTYERFGHEDLGDLVSLCRRCHSKAEEIYDPAVTPWAMEEAKPGGNNFMAAMRADAVAVAPIVFTYLMEVTGGRFDKLMGLRQPVDAEGKKYWCGLKAAVDALCRKRYSLNCVEDRRAMMLEHDIIGKWKDVAEYLGIGNGTLQTLRRDDGTSFGPSLREAVLYYCGKDAAAGIRPLEGLDCLTPEDYRQLDALADYMVSVSGTGKFKGEYTGGTNDS